MRKSGKIRSPGSHENFEAHDVDAGPSDRSFGIVFAIVFMLLAAYGVWKGHGYWPVPAVLSAIFLAVSIFRPALLHRLNRIWTQFGMILQSITNPIILGMIFFFCVLPMGLAMRLAGRDPMRRKPVAADASYWIRRTPEQNKASSLKNQF